MMKLSTGLRLYGIENCPTVSMTATATENEIREVVKALGLIEPTIVLSLLPTLSKITLKSALFKDRPTTMDLKEQRKKTAAEILDW